MKKNTKLLLGAGAALGIGYLLLRKGDGKVAGLGASGPFTPEELTEFNEFDSFYGTEYFAKTDYGDVLAAIAARRGVKLSEAQQDAAYAAAVAQGMDAKGCGTSASRCATDAEILSYYGPFLLQSLADLGLAGESGGASEACPAGTVATGQNADGSLVCTASGSTGGGSSGGGGSTGPGTGTPGEQPPATLPATPPATPPAQDDGGIGIGTIALALAAGGVVWFLLKTDDTKVVKLRESGASKMKEYQRRFDRGAGVNGLRRRRKSKR